MIKKAIRHTKPIIISERILEVGLIINACDIRGDILIVNCKGDGDLKIITSIFENVVIKQTFIRGKLRLPGTIIKKKMTSK